MSLIQALNHLVTSQYVKCKITRLDLLVMQCNMMENENTLSATGRHAEPVVVRQPEERAAVALAPEQPQGALHRLHVLRVVAPSLAIKLGPFRDHIVLNLFWL